MSLEIARRPVGPPHPLFVIAELGLNHGGDDGKALALVDAAARAGASAVKLQSLWANRLVAPGCPAPMHLRAESLQDFLRRFELDEAAHWAVAERARAHGLALISTPFHEEVVDLLERVGCDAYKIASGDITHTRLIARAAGTGKPLVISTGMSNLEEVAGAVACAREAGAGAIALLHCVSAYPVPAGAENLAAIATLRERFDVAVGLSDHTQEPLAPALAVTLGASLYERHLLLSDDDDAIDAAVSSTPEEFAAVIALAARTKRALGTGLRMCSDAEAGNRIASRRGVYAARALAVGTVLDPSHFVMLRPEVGIGAAEWRTLTGRRLAVAVQAGEALLPDVLEA
jgi:sialic acid synthase SpsE